MTVPLMNSSLLLLFCFLVCLPLPTASYPSRSCEKSFYPACSDVLFLWYPFTYSPDSKCGIFHVNCSKDGGRNQFVAGRRRYIIKAVFNEDRILLIQDAQTAGFCHNDLQNLILPYSPLGSFELVSPNYNFLKCNRSQYHNITWGNHNQNIYNYTNCDSSVLYYWPEELVEISVTHRNCSPFTYPINQLLVPEYALKNLSRVLSSGFLVKWHFTPECSDCYSKRGICDWNHTAGKFDCLNPGRNSRSPLARKVIIGASALTGAVVFLVCVVLIFYPRAIFCFTREHKEDRAIENFLKNYGSLVPKRYQYFDLKKITNSFKDKLGQGGFGGVFKGKLEDGRLVAVKVLSSSKCNGEEFMNEVASIGRTNHVNIVNLLGFCSNRSKRALLYEFMPNGSLEQFIYEKTRKANPLGWKKLYEIALGIAKGLEYLHRGCSTRILHLDIKPHNILLDEDFQPKISDFGLAKICPPKESFVSMLGARGTVGYIAPEVFCRNFGGVSHKSDVYSYEMMVLEMVGGRSNIEATAEKTSQVYFPDWIYKRVELNEHLELNGITMIEEEEIARKMIVVALWCIQVDPADRPTTSRVVEMLEGTVESLLIPPRPIFSSPSRTHQPHSSVSTS